MLLCRIRPSLHFQRLSLGSRHSLKTVKRLCQTQPRLPTQPVVIQDKPPAVPIPPEKKDEDKIDPRAWPIALSTVIMGTAIYSVIPVLPLFVKSLGLTTTDLGLIVAIMGFSRLAANIPASALADMYGRRPLLVFGPLGSMVSMVGHGFSSTLHELLSWRVLTGFSSAAQMAGGHLYLADISTSANRGRTLAPMAAAWSAGATLGPAIGGIMADKWGLQAPFFFVAFCVFVISVNNYYRLPETLPPEMRQKHVGESLSHLLREKGFELIAQWKKLLAHKDMQAALLIHTTFWFTLSGSQFTLLPMIATQTWDFSPSNLGYLFCLISVANVVFSHPSAWWSDTQGRKMAIIPGAIIVLLVVAVLPFAASVTQFVGLVLMWGLGASLIGTAPTAFVSDITEVQSRGQALALLRSGGDLGLLGGALIGGFLATTLGIPAVMVGNACLLAVVTAIFAIRATETCGRWAKKKPNP